MKRLYQRTNHDTWWDSNKYTFILKINDQSISPILAKLIRNINE